MSRVLFVHLEEGQVVARCLAEKVGIAAIERLPGGGVRLVCMSSDGAATMSRKLKTHLINNAVPRERHRPITPLWEAGARPTQSPPLARLALPLVGRVWVGANKESIRPWTGLPRASSPARGEDMIVVSAEEFAEIEHHRVDRQREQDDAGDGEADLPLARGEVHAFQARRLFYRHGIAPDARRLRGRVQLDLGLGGLPMLAHATLDKPMPLPSG
jgi:hypothetical protein